MIKHIQSVLPAECPWGDTLHWFTRIDSTNDKAKELARCGAPEGTVVLAGSQTQGRGRLGRSFSSPQGQGIYLSLILRPNCTPGELMHLTCAAGVAMHRAIEKAAGLSIGLKWINDLILEGKKLGGILTELSVDPATGLVEWAVVGIGVNCGRKPEDFPPELQSMATSLSGDIPLPRLAGAMIEALWQMAGQLLMQKEAIMERYSSLCITLGRQVKALWGDRELVGMAVALENDGALVLQTAEGQRVSVNSGEVSIRGMYGYLS